LRRNPIKKSKKTRFIILNQAALSEVISGLIAKYMDIPLIKRNDGKTISAVEIPFQSVS
jgi:hypothetical protein